MLKKVKKWMMTILTAALFALCFSLLSAYTPGYAASKLSAPKVTGKGASVKTVTIKWDSVYGASGYNIYKYNSSKKKYKLVGSVGSGTKVFEIDGLKSGKKYKFKVAAFTENSGKKTVGKKSKVVKVSTLKNKTFSASDFTVYDDAGNTHKLSDYAGMPVIVNIWATWCGPCVSELPHFSKYYNEYGDKVKFFMINCESISDKSYVQYFVNSNGYSFPVYYDFYDSASYAYGTGYIPMNIVFTASGKIIYNQAGSLTESSLRQLIKDAIAN